MFRTTIHVGTLWLLTLAVYLLAGGLLVADDAVPGRRVLMPVDDWPPFRVVTDRSMHGLDFDLMHELEKRMSIDVRFERMPWNRSLIQMQQGKADAMTGLARKPEREAFIYYIEPPYSFCSTVFYTHAGKGEKIRRYEDLYGKRVGFVLGSAYFSRFDEDTQMNKFGVATEDQLLRMIAVGRLDAFVGTDCQVDYEIREKGLDGALDKAAYRPGNRVDLYLGISRYSILFDRIADVEHAMRDMARDGTLDRINAAYFPARKAGGGRSGGAARK